jgi:TetR/AcrR family transcriptional repressor of nem operon
MRVTKAAATENRTRIVQAASALFRERGYDGVGVADLMAAAGFTHGGFYNHFASKADLMAAAAACGLSQTLAETRGESNAAESVRKYLSRSHRDGRGDGCTLAALAGDAARQPVAVKSEFAAGIERLLAVLEAEGADSDCAKGSMRGRSIATLAHCVGALILSRACPDESPLADEILDTCRNEILASLKRG